MATLVAGELTIIILSIHTILENDYFYEKKGCVFSGVECNVWTGGQIYSSMARKGSQKNLSGLTGVSIHGQGRSSFMFN